MEELGKDGHFTSPMMKISTRGLTVALFDERLPTYTLFELHDAVDVVLLCSFEKNIRSEVHGTLFSMADRRRFASVAIRKTTPEDVEGRIDSS